MRNLKKILALALAFVMSLSLMATAGATDFEDDGNVSDIYRQAVEVLSELGVFVGDQDGKFNPDKSITRAEVAAIIYRIATGDVTNERNDTYTPYKQFPDVIAGDWYAGYVTYCANAGYIKGRNTGNFDPKDPVTGYEVLAMILRAVGYDKVNEFTGGNWQEHTASLATQKGVLKNITSSTSLRAEATREVVAELLFQAMLLPQVTYNSATLSYDANRDTLAKENLGLEELYGVVMANKWADLESDTVLKDGLTRLDVDGTDYTLNIDTPITAIGEMRHAYVQNGTDVIGNLTEGDLEDAGISIVAEPENHGGKGSKVTDVAKEGNIKLTADTEYFVNFGEGEYYTSEWQIRYTVKFGSDNITEASAKALFAERYANVDDAVKYDEDRDIDGDDKLVYDNGTYLKVIRAGMEITGYDLLIMQGIFNSSASAAGTTIDNAVEGAVYIGTNQNGNSGWGNNSVTSAQIVSNNYSWNQFFNEYIDNNATNYTQSDNGEWLKIVDKDGDGNADYVLRTDFVMTTVIDYDKESDAYILEYIDPVSAKNIEMPADEINYVTKGLESLVEGDVILYTYIDGVYHVSIPEIEAKATHTSSNYKTNEATFTIDGETGVVKEWSGIDNKAAYYRNDITSLEKGSYTLYYDHFGYVRLFKESSKDFALLNNAYYNTNLRDDEFKAEIFNPETEKLEQVDAWDTVWEGVRDFNSGIINTTEDTVDDIHNSHDNTGHGNRGTWDRLNTFGYYNYEVYQNDNIVTSRHYRYDIGTPTDDHPYADYFRRIFTTNVAAYDVDADGVYNLYDVSAANTYGDESDVLYNAYTLVTIKEAAIDVATGANVTATAASATARTLWGIVDWDRTGAGTDVSPYKWDVTQVQRVHATAATRYYWVVDGGSEDAEIVSWVGFNAPSGFSWDADVNNAYVVTSTVEVDGKTTAYETAEVIVFEGTYKEEATYQSGAIAAQGNVPSTRTEEKTFLRAADYIVAPTVLYLMGWDGSEYTTDIQAKYTKANGDSRYVDGGLLRFYGYHGEDADYSWDLVTEDWYDWNFFAGYVVTERETDNKLTNRYGYLNKAWDIDRTTVDDDGGNAYWHGNESFYDPDTVQVYRFTKVTDAYGRVGYDWTPCTVNYNDKVLYITDENGQAQMIFNVTESIKAAGEGSEVAKKLVGPYDPFGMWNLWNEVQQDYQADCVVNANQVTVNVVTSNGILDGVIAADIAQQVSKSSGNITISLPKAAAFTGTGWSWVVPDAGTTQAVGTSIKVTASDEKTVSWVALSALDKDGNPQIQILGAKLGVIYTVELQVTSASKATVTATLDPADDTTVLAMLSENGVEVSSGESVTFYVAAKTDSVVTVSAFEKLDNIQVTQLASSSMIPEEALDEGVDLNDYPAASYDFWAVSVTRTSTDTTVSTLTISANTGYGLEVDVSSSGSASIFDKANIHFLPGTKLNGITFKVLVDEGNVLRYGTTYATVTSIKMGSTYVPYTAEQKDVNNLNEWTITITADAAAVVQDDLTVKIVTAAGSNELAEQVALNGEDLELTKTTEGSGQTKYEMAVLPDGTQSTIVMTLDTPDDQTVTATGAAAGNVTITSAPAPERAGGMLRWTISINATAIRTAASEAETANAGTGAAQLQFSIVIEQNAAAEVSGTISVKRTVTGEAAETAATVTDVTSGAVDNSTDTAKWTYDLAGAAVTASGVAEIKIGSEVIAEIDVTKDDDAEALATAVAAAINGKIVDDTTASATTTFAAAVDNTTKTKINLTRTATSGTAPSLGALSIVAKASPAAAVAEVYEIDFNSLVVTNSETADTTLTFTVLGEEISIDLATSDTIDDGFIVGKVVTALQATTLNSDWTIAQKGTSDSTEKNTITVTAKTAGVVGTSLAGDTATSVTVTSEIKAAE